MRLKDGMGSPRNHRVPLFILLILQILLSRPFRDAMTLEQVHGDC
jgi:hypothetical protein